MEITTTINSTLRYYADEPLAENYQGCIRSMEQFNDMKMVLYNELYLKHWKQPSKLDHMSYSKLLKEYAAEKGYAAPLSDYFTRGINSAAQGTIRSQKELLKVHIENKKAAVDAGMEKIDLTSKDLDKKRGLKESLKRLNTGGTWKCPYRGCPYSWKDGTLLYRLPGKEPEEVDSIDLEYRTNEQIQKLKNQLSLLKERQKRLEKQLDDLKNKPFPRIVFGTKKQYAKKDDPDTDLAEWKKEFHFARSRSVCLPGVHTSKHGNFTAKLKDGDLHVLNIDGTETVFHSFAPARYENEYYRNMSADKFTRNAVAYSFTRHRDQDGREYLIVSITMTLTNPYCNFVFTDGCIAIDMNWDNICLSDLSADGELLDRLIIPFNMEGKTSGQITNIIGNASRTVGDCCATRGKPLVMEDVDTTKSKNGARYRSAKGNRHMSLFASRKLTAGMMNQGYRKDFEVYLVNPAYTSLAGKILFMRDLGCTIHEAASYCIGLKGMGRYDKLLPDWICALGPQSEKKNRFSSVWGSAYRAFYGLPTHVFYQNVKQMMYDAVHSGGTPWSFKDVAKELKAITGRFPAG